MTRVDYSDFFGFAVVGFFAVVFFAVDLISVFSAAGFTVRVVRLRTGAGGSSGNPSRFR